VDNLTHSLVGLAAAKAGLERLSPYATALSIVAANAPDADVVTLFAGQFTYLEHHRGITHSVVGTLAIAVVLAFIFYAADRLTARLSARYSRRPRAKLSGLLVVSLLASATHPLLDYTNNYGLRPLLPWDSSWFYGDLVFILDPWIWLTLGGACFLLTARTKWRTAAWALLASVLTVAIFLLPGRFGLASPYALWLLWMLALPALILARRIGVASRWGSRSAIAALALVVVYWGALSLLHSRALVQARAAAQSLAERRGETLARVAAMPVFANPLEWVCVAETDRAMNRFQVRVGGRAEGAEWEGPARGPERFEKPQGEERELVELASRDPRAEIFLNFSRFPATRLQRGCVGDLLVQFADLRWTEPGASRRGSFSLDVPITAGVP
jgi:inner membrane protein